MTTDDDLQGTIEHALRELHADAVQTALRRLHNPDFGDIVLPHLIVELHSETPVENGEVLRLFTVANGRTAAQRCPAGTPHFDFRYPVTICD